MVHVLFDFFSVLLQNWNIYSTLVLSFGSSDLEIMTKNLTLNIEIWIKMKNISISD